MTDVQATEAQGDGGMFDSYLQSVPEEQRETVLPYLQDAEKHVNGRLQEAAEFKNQWEPYAGVEPLQQYQPGELEQLLQWHQQVAASDDAYKEWLKNAYEEAGLSPAQADAQADADVESEEEKLSQDKIQQMIAEQTEQQLNPLQEQFQMLEMEKAVDHEDGAIKSELSALEKEHKVQFDEDQRAIILDLGLALATDAKGNELPMGDASWVKEGFKRYQEIGSLHVKNFVESGTKQPTAPMKGGGTERFQKSTDWAEVKKQAAERLRQSAQ